MGLLVRLLGKVYGGGIRRQVDESVAMIRMGIALRLRQKYLPEYGDKASALAAAVNNALFGAEPRDDNGRNFLAANAELIDAKLRDVKGEREICQMVSLALHTLAKIAGKIGSWDRLHKLGIMLPIEQVQMPESLRDLRKRASEFMAQAKSDLRASLPNPK